MEDFTLHNENETPDAVFLNEGSDHSVPTVDDSDYDREFIYENPERIAGAPYFNYLRSYDDML